MSDILARIDDEIADWERHSPDAATWAADGSHEHDPATVEGEITVVIADFEVQTVVEEALPEAVVVVISDETLLSPETLATILGTPAGWLAVSAAEWLAVSAAGEDQHP